MAKNKRAFRARGSKAARGGTPVKGTEQLPVWRRREVLEKGLLGIPIKRSERYLAGTRGSGVPYANPEKDRSLNGKARRRARRQDGAS